MLVLSLGLFVQVITNASKKIDQPFPGYLTFENGVVGAFYVSEWSGYKNGLTYHKIPNSADTTQDQIFNKRDFLQTVLLPAVSGLLFVILGFAIYCYLPSAGRWPFFLFHLLVGNYLVLCPDFHLTYQFSYFLMICFALIPAAMTHFAMMFPEESIRVQKNHRLYLIPYKISFLLIIPYLLFFHQPKVWVKIEYVAFFYLVFSYLFWIGKLFQTLKHPLLDYNRIIAKYLLLGQVVAFSVPLIASLAIFLLDYAFPLNLAAPLALLFPISVFFGIILGRLRQSQVQLIQSEKNAALGNLLAGLAHEINNPMTFIYSAMEPLKEMVKELKTKPNEKTWSNVDQLLGVIEEGATRSKDIIESFRYFSHPDQKQNQKIDLHAVIDQSLELLKPKWKDRIVIQKHYGQLSAFEAATTEMGQIFVNLISNACLAIPNQGKIEITTGTFRGMNLISIKDNGVGMSKETMGKIFNAFYTTRMQGEGTGLGLSIVLGIVRKYGGTLDVKSEINKGSEFIVQLPVKA